MSCYFFGLLNLTKALPVSEVGEVCWATVRQAMRQKIWMFVGYTIPHDEVYQMLGRPRFPVPHDQLWQDVPYLLTGSPMADSSEEVVYPDAGDALPSGEPIIGVVRRKLDNIEKFLLGDLEIEAMDSIQMNISVGFSPNFVRKDFGDGQGFGEALFADWSNGYDFSSLQLTMRRKT